MVKILQLCYVRGFLFVGVSGGVSFQGFKASRLRGFEALGSGLEATISLSPKPQRRL